MPTASLCSVTDGELVKTSLESGWKHTVHDSIELFTASDYTTIDKALSELLKNGECVPLVKTITEETLYATSFLIRYVLTNDIDFAAWTGYYARNIAKHLAWHLYKEAGQRFSNEDLIKSALVLDEVTIQYSTVEYLKSMSLEEKNILNLRRESQKRGGFFQDQIEQYFDRANISY
ncbi:MAG: hypothetical protein KDE58_19625 [Caldilineaceae bacterium]|nr:hypothetical protein [Caldilineaceae bacterium]